MGFKLFATGIFGSNWQTKVGHKKAPLLRARLIFQIYSITFYQQEDFQELLQALGLLDFLL